MYMYMYFSTYMYMYMYMDTYMYMLFSFFREGHFEATELLLDHQANLNIPSGSNDDTPLTLACWKGHEGVVKLLLERQSSINHQTKTGCTPLMEATRYNVHVYT